MFLCRYTLSTIPYVCIEITLTHLSKYKIYTFSCCINGRLSAIYYDVSGEKGVGEK